MAPPKLYRTAPDLEVRNGGDGRTITGLAVPFGRDTEVSDGGGHYLERFVRGAFARTIAERGDRVKLLAQHQRTQLPVGRATVLREDPAGLYAELKVSKTEAGDEVLELVRDGALDGLSVGFRPIRDRQAGTVLERVEVRLDEISAVAFPAYDDARVLAVRQEQLPPLPVDLARQRLDLLRARTTR